MVTSKINFGAGPAALPPEVLHEAAKSIKKYKTSGISVLELPHRGPEFREILEESRSLVRELMGVGDDYEVLWMQGGGRLQFAMLPMNFLSRGETAGYYNSGHWATEAIKYAEYYGNVQTLGSSADTNHDHLPALLDKVPDNLKYVHITTNNTIYGTQFHNIPSINVPLVADMSSDIFSGKHDYSKYSMIYAAAQKNLGTSGNCLVVIKRSFLESIKNHLPPMLSYKDQVAEGSILNTANVSGIYVSLLMLRWIKENGIEKLGKDNQRKADMIYNVLDNGSLFEPHVKVKADRSLMNICFRAKDIETETRFNELCNSNGVLGVKGHRLVGGFRVSNYNAIAVEWVEELVQLMNQLENR